VSNNVVLEVVSGLGIGGAEKALLSRLKNAPTNFQTTLLNTRPELDALALQKDIKMIDIRARFIVFLPGIRQVLIAVKPDLIIVRTPLDAIRFSLIKLFSSNQSWKLIFEAHSNFVSAKIIINKFMKIILVALKKRIDHFIAVSENVRQGPLCKNHANSSVVYMGAESESNNRKFDDTSRPKLLFLGRITKIKRPLSLIEAISKLAAEFTLDEGFLTILGDGELRGDLDEMVASYGLNGVVNVLGYKADVSDYLLNCTHLVSVSSNEGLPISFFEAKLSGMRIISTPSGGGSEIFDDFDYELPSFEIEDLIDHLRSVLGKEITGESRLQIAKNSSWMQSNLCSKKYYDLLEILADR
jgi:glycosyltransferase involved in cell wall biosynthesis